MALQDNDKVTTMSKGTEPNITLDILNIAYPKASAKKSVDPEFKAKADAYTKHIQDKEIPKKRRNQKIWMLQKLLMLRQKIYFQILRLA